MDNPTKNPPQKFFSREELNELKKDPCVDFRKNAYYCKREKLRKTIKKEECDQILEDYRECLQNWRLMLRTVFPPEERKKMQQKELQRKLRKPLGHAYSLNNPF